MTDQSAEIGEEVWSSVPVIGVLLGYLVLGVGLLYASGALASGFGAHDDEAAHLVSSLMLHDYVASGFSGSPVEFAKDYYVHYPKVTLGHWPPMMAAATGTWMLLAGTSKLAVLMFLVGLAVATAMLIYLGSRRDVGDGLAVLAGGLFLLLPTIQWAQHNVMTELPLAFSCTAAAFCFGRFLETDRARYSVLFGLFAVWGILTKGSALALALVPPVAIALSRRWDLLRRPALWVSAGIVGLACGPWYVATIDISTSSWVGGSSPTAGHTFEAAIFYPWELIKLAGFGVALVALFGVFGVLGSDLKRGRWAALFAWLPASLLPYVFVPTGLQARHLALAVPVWIMLAALGTRAAMAHLPKLRWSGIHAVPLLILVSLLPLARIVRKDVHGYESAARDLLADASLADAVFLIESDAIGEGSFIAGVAMNEERPGHVVLRASKMLGTTDWMGRGYESAFESVEDMEAFLKRVPVDVLVIDDSAGRRHRYPHLDDLLAIVAGDTETWRSFGTYDVVREGGEYPSSLKVFAQRVPAGHPRQELTFDDVVGRELPSMRQ